MYSLHKYKILKQKYLQLKPVFCRQWSTVACIEELSVCHKPWFSNPYIFATQCRRAQIVKTMNSVWSNNQSLKYKWFTPYGYKDIWIKKKVYCKPNNLFWCNHTRRDTSVPKTINNNNDNNISKIVFYPRVIF